MRTDLAPKTESEGHLETKKLIERMAATNGRWFIVAVEGFSGYTSYQLALKHTKVVLECSDQGEPVVDIDEHLERTGRYPNMIFDVGFVVDGAVVAAIEVVKTHGIDNRKAAKIRASGVLCLAVKSASHHWYVDDRRLEAIEIITSPEAKITMKRLGTALT